MGSGPDIGQQRGSRRKEQGKRNKGRMEYWNTGRMEIIKVAGYKLTPDDSRLTVEERD
jgi:hypothetical protein